MYMSHLPNGLLIANTTFENNKVELEEHSFGGAIVFRSITGRPIAITQSRFERNQAAIGGAIYTAYSSLSITKSTFERNKAKGYGGAVAADSSYITSIAQCTFRQMKPKIQLRPILLT